MKEEWKELPRHSHIREFGREPNNNCNPVDDHSQVEDEEDRRDQEFKLSITVKSFFAYKE